MRNVPGKSCRENENTNFRCSSFFENGAVDELMWKNTVEAGRPQMAMHPMRITCRILKTTNTNSEYVFLRGFPQQQ
jgi:hypothetical protein